jgi:diguanylate cyclase (GGDEF)-like protein
VPDPSRASVWELDEVTGLPGRRWLQRMLLADLPAGLERAVAVLDVDAFALVNQVYGPESGDHVLAELASRFSSVCAPAVIGRWQADEFVFVLDAVDAGQQLAALLELAAASGREPLALADEQIRVTFSAGLATTELVPEATLFRSAAAAMATAKAHGRDRTELFDARTMSALPGPGLRMANDLQRGLSNDELRLYYQPIVELATNDVVGAEALVRWERPGVGLLAPAAFLEVAERTGQIIALGEWVIRTACQAAVNFASTRLVPLRVSINVSARQLSDPGLLATIESALEEAGCDPRDVVIEVTETALLHDLGIAAGVLEDVRLLGIELDLDDFGTGYSSLLYLKHFPVSRIKIDQAFVAGLGTVVADTAIVASTIALAHSIGITAIAEGVETPQQLALLRQMKCDYAQGYLLSVPLSEPELIAWLDRQVPSRLLQRAAPDGEPGERTPASIRGRQERRDNVADDRDVAGDLRDRAGDVRDQVADQRDSVGDLRDLARDRRDALADERDGIADERDRASGPVAAGSSGSSVGPPEHLDRAADRAAADRHGGRAADDRATAAAERGEARTERDLARADRTAEDVVREKQDQTRHPVASPPSPSQVLADRPTDYDSLTGAYLWGVGLPALEAEARSAAREGDRVNLVHVRLLPGPDIGHVREQLAEDGALVMIANALGGALDRQDLLVRRTAREFVCLIRRPSDTGSPTPLATVLGALSSDWFLEVEVAVGHSVLRSGETVEGAIARAARRDTGA